MNSKNLEWFDAARGISATVVLIAHGYYIFRSRLTGGSDAISIALGIAAEYAVYVFFFMSGYLITLSIRNNIRRNGSFDSIEYLLSRVARIYPPLIGAICIVFIVGTLINAFDLPDLGLPGRERYEYQFAHIWRAITMRGGFGIADGPLWSLYIEGQIYIIAGGIAMTGWTRKPIPMALGVAVVYLGISLQKSPFFIFYSAIWIAGSISSFVPNISVKFPHPPKILNVAGGFSYTLYVFHFPLMLLWWSIVQKLGLSDGPWNPLLMFIALSATLIASYYFAIYFENTKYFKKLPFLAFSLIPKSQ